MVQPVAQSHVMERTGGSGTQIRLPDVGLRRSQDLLLGDAPRRRVWQRYVATMRFPEARYRGIAR
jgi:hypothetical protein